MSYFVPERKLKKKQQEENVIIRSSHQTDVVIKSEDIKKIRRDDFTLIHCSLKKNVR